MLEPLLDLAGGLVLLGGCALATIGLYGMHRRRDIFEQLHAAGLVTGPGAILVLLASFATRDAEIITSALLVVVFVLVTSSLSTHVIALAAHQRYGPVPGTDEDPTRSGSRTGSSPEADDPVHRETTAMVVLLAHDGSPSAHLAADLAAALPWPPGTLIRVAGVITDDLPPLAGWNDDPPDLPESTASDLRMIIDAAAARFRAGDVRAEAALLEGDPALAIVADANASRADLVIVGTRTLDTRSTLAVSVAGEIVDRAPCPVLVARRRSVSRILLPTDGSEPSAAAAELVARWPLFASTSVTVVSVAMAEDGRGGGQPGDRSDAARTAELAAERLRAVGRHATADVVVGSAAPSITALASASGVDLIVLGSRGRTGLTRSVLGSVTRDVLTTADCSVLVVTR